MIIIFMALTLFASCQSSGENGDGGTTNPQNTGDTTTSEAGEVPGTEESKILPNLPEADFGGVTITFLTRKRFEGATGWSAFRDLFSETENGDPLNDAVHARNSALEEKYNFTLTIIDTTTGQPSDEIKKSAAAGDGAYDAVITDLGQCPDLAFGGYFADLKTVPNIDLSMPWWDQNANEAFNIANRVYFTTGDITTQAVDATFTVLFNKKLIEDLSLETPYQYVRDNTWTFDKMLAMMNDSGVSQDLNGDGTMELDDRFALATNFRFADALFFASGTRVTQKDADGIPQFSFNTQKTLSVLDKAINFMNKQTTLDYSNIDDGWTKAENSFVENRVLFYGGVLQLFSRLRGMNDAFGLLPLPKWDDSQDNYHHEVIDKGGMFAIPAELSDERLSIVGHVVEAMFAESTYTIVPAYYEKTLTTKLMRDADSEEMLDIIINNRVFDIGFTKNWGGLYSSSFSSNVLNGTTNFASAYESAEAAATTEKDNHMAAILGQ
jgi:hypothetical protein